MDKHEENDLQKQDNHENDMYSRSMNCFILMFKKTQSVAGGGRNVLKKSKQYDDS